MALDGIFLSIVKNELEKTLLDGRVDKIYQPSREEIVFGIRSREGSFRLLFNVDANAARVHITNAEIENPKTPPMFCMLMRKHLSSGKLISIRQDGFERILYFDFDSVNEMGDMCRLTLAMEIMGRHSNLILINSQGRIIDSIKRIGSDMSSVRMVLPNLEYSLPPKDERMSLFDYERERLASVLAENSSKPLSKTVLRAFEGISPVFAREAEFYCAKGKELNCCDVTDDILDRLCFFLKKTATDITATNNRFTVLKTKDGMFKDFCFCDISQYGSLMVTSQMESACATLDYYFAQRDLTGRMKQKASDLFRLLISTSERISRRIANQKQELVECAKRDELKTNGDLIMANIYRLEKGQAVAEVENYYDENNPTVTIALDKRLTPSQNAQKYYAEYRKADTAEKMLTGLVKSGEEELAYIDSVFDSLTRSTTENEIEQLREELAEQGYVKRSRIKGKPPKALPPLRFVSSDGYEILVGRNNKQNDKLTTKDSEKTDLWFHTHNITGSHTVISCSDTTPPDTTINEAAMLAAFHSKARTSSRVPVDYTQIKFVRKPAGSKPGMVIFTNNKTVYVTPDEQAVEKLRDEKQR